MVWSYRNPAPGQSEADWREENWEKRAAKWSPEDEPPEEEEEDEPGS